MANFAIRHLHLASVCIYVLYIYMIEWMCFSALTAARCCCWSWCVTHLANQRIDLTAIHITHTIKTCIYLFHLWWYLTVSLMHASIYCNKIHIISVIINEGVINTTGCVQKKRRKNNKQTEKRRSTQTTNFHWWHQKIGKSFSFILHGKQK